MSTSDKNFKVKNGLDANGNITASGDISAAGALKSTFSSGDEGGEIILSKPVTNTTIAGNAVTVDVYQNKIRFFENGGDARGYYIDITGGASGASTNLVGSGGGGSASDSFKTISVAGQNNVVADSSTDTLTFVAGTNVSITTDATTDSITLNATDTNTTYSVSAETATGGANLRLTGSDAVTDDVKIEGSGATTVTRTDANTITISSTDTDTVTNAFTNIEVAGQDTISAETTSDTLTLVAGTNITLTTNATNDTITIDSSGGGGGGASVTVSDTAPSTPAEGDLWYDSSAAKLYIYYDNFWIQSVPNESGVAAATSPIFYNSSTQTISIDQSLLSLDIDQITSSTSSELASVISDETGSGLLVFGTAPTISLPAINNIKTGYTSTATSATSVFLTVDSNKVQRFTGTVAQNLFLPDAGTLTLGMQYEVINDSTNTVSVRSSEGNPIFDQPAGTLALYTCILASGTTSASWIVDVSGASTITGTGSLVLSNSPSITGDMTVSGNLISHITRNPQTASYPLVLSDDGKMIEMSVSSANTVTIPLNSAHAFPVGTQIIVLQTGTGQTTINGSVGVTINCSPQTTANTAVLRAQWSSATLIKRAENTWVVVGDLA